MSLLVWKIEPSRTSSSRSSPRVDEVAVVRDGDLTVRAIDQDRLSVFELALARRRVARVADRQVARQLLERRLVECFGHLPHRARRRESGLPSAATMPALSWPRCWSA